MIHTRKEMGNSPKFVLLSFTAEEGDSSLNDETVQMAMTEEQLRPVSKDEFKAFCGEVLKEGKPKTSIAAFGNTVRGPEDSGSFPGVPYLNINGEIGVNENWTRGNTGDLWGDDWEFVFTPAA